MNSNINLYGGKEGSAEYYQKLKAEEDAVKNEQQRQTTIRVLNVVGFLFGIAYPFIRKYDHMINGKGDGTTTAGLIMWIIFGLVYLVCVFDKMPQFISNNDKIFLGIFGVSAILCVVAGFMMVFGKDKEEFTDNDENKEDTEDKEDTDSD